MYTVNPELLSLANNLFEKSAVDPAMDPAMMDPAMMGGMPPEAAKMASANRAVTRDLVNLVKYSQHYRKAGKFKFTEAKTAQQRNLRDQIKLCVRDIIG